MSIEKSKWLLPSTMQDSCQRSFICTILFCYLNYIHYLGRWKSVVLWYMRNMHLVFHPASGTKLLILLEFPKCDKGIFCYVNRVCSCSWGLVAYGVSLVIRWWELLVPTLDLWEGGKAEDELSLSCFPFYYFLHIRPFILYLLHLSMRLHPKDEMRTGLDNLEIPLIFFSFF